LSIHLRCYSEATEVRFASYVDCGQQELRNAGAGLVVTHAPPAWGRHGIADFWRARRAVAFIAISMNYQSLSNHKVHFEPKSVFQAMPP